MKQLILKPEHKNDIIQKPYGNEVLHMSFVEPVMYNYLYTNGYQHLFDVVDDEIKQMDEFDIPIYIDPTEDLPILDYTNKKTNKK